MFLFRKVLHCFLKKNFAAADMGKRQLLQDGHVFLALSYADGVGGGGAAGSASDVIIHSGAIFFQVAVHYLKPYRPTFHLFYDGLRPPGEPAESDTFRYVKAMSGLVMHFNKHVALPHTYCNVAYDMDFEWWSLVLVALK